MAQLSRAVTNKLLHPPSAALRQASAEGRTELIAAARELFGLQADDTETQEKSEPE